MWRTMTYATIFVGLVLLASVKGSCLEYGHSCWGAHGKRSGGTGTSKVLRGPTNLRTGELHLLGEDNGSRLLASKPLYESFDELNSSMENSPHGLLSSEDNAPDADESAKIRNFLGQRRAKYLQHSANSKSNNADHGNNNVDESAERRQQQRVGARWHKIPLFQLKPTFGNVPPQFAPLTLGGSTRREEDPAVGGVYYDFK